MGFSEEKKKYLGALGGPDRSKKGSVDEAVWPLLDAINSCEEYYTTSSCSGRTSLFLEGSRKDQGEWLYVTHEEPSLEDFKPALEKLPSGSVWFKFEGAILHVVARTEDDANKLLRLSREAGFKHAGLLGTKKRYTVEIVDSERLDVPVAIDSALIVDEGFIAYLCERACEKLEKTHDRLKRLKALF